MARTPRSTVPQIRRHRPSARAVVTLSGQDHYLGPWPLDQDQPSEDVLALYGELIGRWLASGRRALAKATDASANGKAETDADGKSLLRINGLILRYLDHARGYYTDPETKEPNKEYGNLLLAFRPLAFMHGNTLANDYGPSKLKALRELLIAGYNHPRHGPQEALSRGVINRRIGMIKRMFKWASSEELVDPTAYYGLQSVGGLKAGRTHARETPRVLPVPLEVVQETLPKLPPHVAGILELMLHTGARPAEICRITPGQIDRTGSLWVYKPRRHKTQHHGKERIILIGPKGQAVLRRFIRVTCPRCRCETGRPEVLGWGNDLCPDCVRRINAESAYFGACPFGIPEAHGADEPIFSPLRQREERFYRMRKRRRTKVQPSQRNRKKAKPQRLPGTWYTPEVLGRAVALACRKNKIPHWHPNQLRHLAATLIRARHGIEAASTILGHSRLNTTEIYAERNLSLAERIAAEMG